MDLLWKIGAGIAVLLLMIRLIQYVSRVRASIRRLRVAEERIRAEATEIRGLDLSKAEQAGMQVFRDKAVVEVWQKPIPVKVLQAIEKLDSSVQSMFKTYSGWYFPDTGTQFRADYLQESGSLAGTWQIGLDKSLGHRLLAKSGSALILEVNEEDRVLEQYPSIFHYFLLAEEE